MKPSHILMCLKRLRKGFDVTEKKKNDVALARVEMIERRELLMAHINTLDMVIGPDYLALVEGGYLSKLKEWKEALTITATAEVDEKFIFLTVADLYRDMLEKRLKEV